MCVEPFFEIHSCLFFFPVTNCMNLYAVEDTFVNFELLVLPPDPTHIVFLKFLFVQLKARLPVSQHHLRWWRFPRFNFKSGIVCVDLNVLQQPVVPFSTSRVHIFDVRNRRPPFG